MALTFGAATSDRVECGTGASLECQEAFTVMAWIFPTTLTNNRRIFQKVSNVAGVGFRQLWVNGTGGNLQMDVDCATTDATYITNDTPIVTLNKWYFIAATWDSAAAAGQKINIYKGDLTTAIAESTYATAQDNVGATVSPAGGQFVIGNRGTPATSNVAFQGSIGHLSFYSVVLTSAQIEAQRLRQFTGSNCQGFWQCGFDGTGTQLDHSGNANNGTVTGASASAHHPYIIPASSVISGAKGIIRTGSSIGRVA